jgi:hypothetical protein
MAGALSHRTGIALVVGALVMEADIVGDNSASTDAA